MRRGTRRSPLWHPYKGLWNPWAMRRATRPTRALVRLATEPGRAGGSLAARLSRALNRLVVRALVAADTAILFLRAAHRRMAVAGIRAVVRPRRLPPASPVVYLDLGTHRIGKELRWMARHVLPDAGVDFRAYGFEANESSFEAASAALADVPGVELVLLALVHEVPEAGTVRLHSSRRGLRDSIHRPGDFEQDVAAGRLSDWLAARGIDLERTICLLRMNIEGAEFDVLRDLVEAGLAGLVDGYYGMWDDLYKFDPAADGEFRAFLARHGIRTHTFNGRDMHWAMRRRCIRYDVLTSLLAGSARLDGRPRA